MLRSPVGEPPLSLPPLELHAREPARDVACVPYAGPFQLRFQAADPQTETARLLGQLVLEPSLSTSGETLTIEVSMNL